MACGSKDRSVEDDGNGWLVDRRIGRLRIKGTDGLCTSGTIGDSGVPVIGFNE